MSNGTFAEYAERKLERLRLGQATCEVVPLPSDMEMRVALVPLTEAEYSNALHEAATVPVDENAAGVAYRDEIQRQYIIYYATRVVGKLGVHFFDSASDVGELEAHEINHLFDAYLELVATVSPSLLGLTEEDFNDLKKGLQAIPWSELSGQQWYAAQRFLNSIRPLLLMDRFSGSHSTTPSTEKSIEPTNAESV